MQKFADALMCLYTNLWDFGKMFSSVYKNYIQKEKYYQKFSLHK